MAWSKGPRASDFRADELRGLPYGEFETDDPQPADATAVSGGNRTATWTTYFTGGQDDLYALYRLLLFYNSALNTSLGTTTTPNSQYRGRTRVGVDFEETQLFRIAHNPGANHTVARYLGRRVGHTRIGVTEASATVQIIDVDLRDMLLGPGSSLFAKWSEHPYWGAFLSAQLLARQVGSHP